LLLAFSANVESIDYSENRIATVFRWGTSKKKSPVRRFLFFLTVVLGGVPVKSTLLWESFAKQVIPLQSLWEIGNRLT
jgi:hypothetical protein